MTDDLLLNIQDMQLSRDTFDAIRFINLTVDVLHTLKKKGVFFIVNSSTSLAPNMLLPIEQCPRIRSALDGTLRENLSWDVVDD